MPHSNRWDQPRSQRPDAFLRYVASRGDDRGDVHEIWKRGEILEPWYVVGTSSLLNHTAEERTDAEIATFAM